MNAPLSPSFLSRRQLLQGAAAALVVGFSADASLARNSAPALASPKSVAKDAVDSFLTMHADGQVTIYVGKVDLGTGTKTALAQIAADELDVPFASITMVMGEMATPP